MPLCNMALELYSLCEFFHTSCDCCQVLTGIFWACILLPRRRDVQLQNYLWIPFMQRGMALRADLCHRSSTLDVYTMYILLTCISAQCIRAQDNVICGKIIYNIDIFKECSCFVFKTHLLNIKQKGFCLWLCCVCVCSGGGGNFVLSSSLVGYTTVLGVVAPMVHHGYGFFYRIRDDRWAHETHFHTYLFNMPIFWL